MHFHLSLYHVISFHIIYFIFWYYLRLYRFLSLCSQTRSRCIYHLARNAHSRPPTRIDHAKTNVPDIYPSAGTVSRTDVPFWWLKGQNWIIEITDIKGILMTLIVRSGKKFRAFREAILRIASESRTIDEISVVFRKPSRVAISLKLCTQYEQYIVVEF